MFGISIFEIFIVVIVAMLVLHPEDYHSTMKLITSFIRKYRSIIESTKLSTERFLNDIDLYDDQIMIQKEFKKLDKQSEDHKIEAIPQYRKNTIVQKKTKRRNPNQVLKYYQSDAVISPEQKIIQKEHKIKSQNHK